MAQLVVSTIINILVLSSMYILVALGFAFLFSILGILNLAHGAFYMISGYLCFQFAVHWGLNQWLSMLISVLLVGSFGVVVEKFCFRPFIGDLNRVVTVCIAIITILQTSVNLAMGIYVESLPAFVEGTLKIGSFSISAERIVTFAIGCVLLSCIILLIRKTRIGQQMLAISQNREASELQGIDVNRVSGLACFIAFSLAAVAGCLMAAYLNLNAFMGDYILLKAIVIVIMGGIGSIVGVFFAGLVLGTLDAALPVFISGAASEAITLGIIVVILLFKPRGFFGRELETEEKHEYSDTAIFPATDRGKIYKLMIYGIIAIFVLIIPFFVKYYLLHVFILTLIYIIAASSLRLITISGQFPLAHAAFMGIGAYAAAIPAKWLEWPVWVTIPLAGLISMLVGVFIGFPFARLRALYYAMVSLFFGTGVLYFIFTFGIWTGSYSGLAGIPMILPASKLVHFYFFLGITAACLFALYRFEFSRIGINFRAVSQSHLLASSLGINEAKYRVFALAVGCFFVGLAGAFYAHYNLTISYTSFNMSATLWLFMYVIIGGLNSFKGPIIGTILLMVLPELFRSLKGFVPFISAGILLLVVYIMPEGLVGLPRVLRSIGLLRIVQPLITRNPREKRHPHAS